jgi:hypothetical protein
MTPVLAFSQEVDSTAANTLSLVSSSFAVANGDVIVVKTCSENQGAPVANTPTAPGQTFTDKNTAANGSECDAHIFACVVTGAPGTLIVTSPWATTAGWHSAVFERWTGAQLAATPATNGTKVVNSANGFTGAITTAAANSVVTWMAGDWSATAPGTVAYRSSATQDGLHNKSPSNYVAYYAYQSAGAAGAQTFGLTTPVATATWKYLAMEVQDAGGAPAIPPILVMQTRRAY